MRKLRYGIFAAAFVLIAAGSAQAQPYYGPGMMGGYGGGYGPGYGMMGGGYGPGYGMMGGYGGGWGMGPGMMGQGYGGGYGPGWMMGPGMMGYGYGGGYGPGMMGYGGGYYGNQGNPGNQGNLNLSADQVKSYLEQMIRNPNLKVGDVKEKDADTVVADIVTKDKNALVQRLEFNRHNGFMQPEQ